MRKIHTYVCVYFYIYIYIYTRWEKIVGKMQRFGMGEGDEVSGWLVFRILI